MSRHYIADISLNVTFTHNQPTNQPTNQPIYNLCLSYNTFHLLTHTYNFLFTISHECYIIFSTSESSHRNIDSLFD